MHHAIRRTAMAVALAAPVLAVGLPALWHPAGAQTLSRRVVPGTVPNAALRIGASATEVGVSPTPGSRSAQAATQISFVGLPASQLGQITVTGSVTGVHSGRLLAYSQGDGGSFVPDKPFALGELVTVKTDLDIADAPSGTFRFGIATPAEGIPSPAAAQTPSSTSTSTSSTAGSSGFTHYVSRPDLVPPTISVTTNHPGTAPGYVFLAPALGNGQRGPMIANSNGTVVWWDPIAHTSVENFRVQKYGGEPVLTYWQGQVINGHAFGEDVILNSSYQQVAVVRAGNGLAADLHDFVIYPNGTALMTAYQAVLWNETSLGGTKSGIVLDSVAQEIDLKTGLVRFQWDSLDHVALNQTYAPFPPHSGQFDYLHINSTVLTPAGDLLICGRNTHAVYDVDLTTGRTIWTLGGRASSFVMGPGTVFAWQHDAELHPDGTMSMFDDELPPSPPDPQARGLVISLDLTNHTATLVQQFDHVPRLSTPSEGNLQELPNGDVMIGWGPVGYYTEYSSTGTVLLDAKLPAGYTSYRAYRFMWTGDPTTKPAIATKAKAGGALVVYASWNGATQVTSWRVVGGATISALKEVGWAASHGFETQIPIAGPMPVIEAEALNIHGQVIGTSAVIRF